MKLDRNKPFGTRYGMTGLIGYTQDGRDFDIDGLAEGAEPEAAPAPRKPGKAAPIAQREAAPLSLGGASEQPEDDGDGEDGPADDEQGDDSPMDDEPPTGAQRIVHLGFGRYVVLDADGTRICTPRTKAEAEAIIVSEGVPR